MYFSVLYPEAYPVLMVAITFVEGYSFYCFFALITTNLGGPAATVDLMFQSQRPLVCSCCCPVDSAIFYQKTTWAIFHLFVTRSVLSVLAVLCFYVGNKLAKLAYVSLNVLSAAILFYGVVCLVNLCKHFLPIPVYCILLFCLSRLC
jgi:hypothetical protein